MTSATKLLYFKLWSKKRPTAHANTTKTLSRETGAVVHTATFFILKRHLASLFFGVCICPWDLCKKIDDGDNNSHHSKAVTRLHLKLNILPHSFPLWVHLAPPHPPSFRPSSVASGIHVFLTPVSEIYWYPENLRTFLLSSTPPFQTSKFILYEYCAVFRLRMLL